jgi:hypothetical protein
MDLSAFELLKNNARTNANSRLHDTPVISYARIIRVIDIQTVICEAIIQPALAREVYTVTLLNLSSGLLELNAYPKLGDTALLLFLQRYDPRMFVQETVRNPNAAGYNKFSGVGVLMSTVKGAARTVLHFFEEDGNPVAELKSDAQWLGTFNGAMAVTFCRAVYDSGDERLINLVFGEGRPCKAQFLDRVTRLYGFWKDNDNEWVPLDAAVTERYSNYAPITRDIQGSQTIDVGLSTDKDDNPVETNAPITQTIHGKAPIVTNIRSPQTITIGIGNSESGSPGEQRNADIDVTIGEKADMTIESDSLLDATFWRDMDFRSEKPIGFNDGLYRTGLQPYWNSETEAVQQLLNAATLAIPQMVILDAMSGGLTFIKGLNEAIINFCNIIKAADETAHFYTSKVAK